MDLDKLANLGEFVGGVFVLITLVYLAYQLRQNTKSLRIENYARVLERMSTLQSQLAAEPELRCRRWLARATPKGRGDTASGRPAGRGVRRSTTWSTRRA